MAAVIRKVWQGYEYLFMELSDPRTRDWLLMAPYQVFPLLGLYLMFILKWGPQLMKNRQPFNLNKVLIAYNLFQVIACAYVLFRGLYLAWGWDYKWICEPVDFSTNPRAVEIASCSYSYYMLKIIDLLDTVFFVLRKKFNQVSFLHIYHHAGMVILIWGAVLYLPGGHGTLIGVINSFVHTVMYSYYLMTVAIPSVKNAIWIKKLVTQLQILQFFWCVVHMAALVFKTDCAYPRWTAAIFLPQNLFMLVLFIDFYIKTYIKKPRKQLREQFNITNVNNLNGNKKYNNINNNGTIKENIENNSNNDKNIYGAKIFLKNDLSNNVKSYTNNNDKLRQNINILKNGKDKTS